MKKFLVTVSATIVALVGFAPVANASTSHWTSVKWEHAKPAVESWSHVKPLVESWS